MPIKSEPYYFAVCDNCGERADYDEYSAWSDSGVAADQAIDGDWTHKGEVFHCPACPPLDAEEEE